MLGHGMWEFQCLHMPAPQDISHVSDDQLNNSSDIHLSLAPAPSPHISHWMSWVKRWTVQQIIPNEARGHLTHLSQSCTKDALEILLGTARLSESAQHTGVWPKRCVEEARRVGCQHPALPEQITAASVGWMSALWISVSQVHPSMHFSCHGQAGF